jgi:sialate O-acetylesterase
MIKSTTVLIGAMVIALGYGFTAVRADVKYSPIFSDQMVLQREMPVPVWGTAVPGEVVTVTFAGQSKTATAETNGHWMVRLDPMPACAEPRRMTVTGSIPDPKTKTGAEQLGHKFENVLVGEVWVGSGQSNMQLGTGDFTKGDAGLSQLVTNAPYPKLRLGSFNRPWQEATAKNVNGFSALLFAFGVRLQSELDVPVGLLLGAQGATPSGAWLSRAALKNDAACQTMLESYKTSPRYTAALMAYQAAAAKYPQELAAWKLDAAATAAASNSTATVKSPVAKHAPREPIPPVIGPTCAVGSLYEAYIRPLIPYAIRGVLWDQGESRTAITGVDQYTLMGALIRGWRKDWGGAEFPFIFVQKPSGGGCAWDYTNPVTKNSDSFKALPAAVPSDGGEFVQFIQMMSYPNVGMAISSDLGGLIHPVNKSGYGHRAADVALGMVYGKKIEYYGPRYDSHKIEGHALRVHFTHVGKGLALKNGDKLQGFALAGADKVFHWADVTIDGETVVLSCVAVKEPIAVRYAWSSNRTWANLFNKDGLPAIPFRTDNW